MNRKLLALTVLQPFATAIVWWGKPVENRGWLPGTRLPVGSWLAIHAGARDYPGCDEDDFRVWIAGFADPLPEKLERRANGAVWAARGYATSLPHSAIVGVGRVGGFDDRPPGWSGWAHPEQHHWRFDAVVPFVAPVACKGAQGLWTVPDDVAVTCRVAFAASKSNLRVYP